MVYLFLHKSFQLRVKLCLSSLIELLANGENVNGQDEYGYSPM